MPIFREDPGLLNADDPLVSTNNPSPKPSVPDIIKVKSSVLVVDNIEEEASLTQDPSIRSQRLSVDHSGNRTYVIEDNQEISCTCLEKSDIVESINLETVVSKEAMCISENHLEDMKCLTTNPDCSNGTAKCEKECHEENLECSKEVYSAHPSSESLPMQQINSSKASEEEQEGIDNKEITNTLIW